jgi:hypothetical protein
MTDLPRNGMPTHLNSNTSSSTMRSFSNLSTNQNHIFLVQSLTYLRDNSGASLVGTASPEDCKTSRTRWEEQQQLLAVLLDVKPGVWLIPAKDRRPWRRNDCKALRYF